MFIGYNETMRTLKHEQLMERSKKKTINLNLKAIFLIVFNIFSFKTNFQEGYKLENNSSKKIYHTSELLLSQVRGGSSDPEQIISESLKEINYVRKLKKNILDNSPSFNKSLMDIYNKIIDPFLSILLEKPEARTLLKQFLDRPFSPNDDYDLKLRQPSLKKPENTKTLLFAEAGLIPINSRFWLAHGFGSRVPNIVNDVLKTKNDVISEVLNTPVANFKTSCEYLYRSKSEIEYRSRFWRVVRDTTVVNALSVNDIGAFLGGAYASTATEQYMEEMINRELFPNEIEKLNMEIYKQVAKSKNISPDLVEGTGLFRDFVREEDKVDLCQNPKNKRPIWEEETYNGKLGDTDSYQ